MRPEATHIVGMARRDADRTRAKRPPEPLHRLRAVGITGFFRPAQLERAGLTRDQLPALVRAGTVERVSRGLYRVAAAEPTEHYSLAMASARVPNGIICLLSALTVHGLGTQLPREVWMAIPHKARRPRVPGLPMKVVRFSGAALRYGVERTTFEGVPGRVTNPARTVVDCFRFQRLVGKDVALEAIREALRERKATPNEIWRAAEVCRARSLVGPVLEALSE